MYRWDSGHSCIAGILDIHVSLGFWTFMYRWDSGHSCIAGILDIPLYLAFWLPKCTGVWTFMYCWESGHSFRSGLLGCRDTQKCWSFRHIRDLGVFLALSDFGPSCPSGILGQSLGFLVFMAHRVYGHLFILWDSGLYRGILEINEYLRSLIYPGFWALHRNSGNL
jgi:hypothetical protein